MLIFGFMQEPYDYFELRVNNYATYEQCIARIDNLEKNAFQRINENSLLVIYPHGTTHVFCKEAK